MSWKGWLGLLLAIQPLNSFAELTSYHFANPIGIMHDLPVGETPGWSTSTWANLEVSTSNIWNHKATFTDTRNGNVYSYFADYESETAYAELGFAMTSHVAFSVEVPYTNHNGGFMDDAVDHFHQLIYSDRFMRDVSPKFGNHFQVQTNGVNTLSTEHAEGTGNLKAKLKYWFWQMKAATPGACDCGMAVSGQVKFPMQAREHGLTSGHNDYSGLAHLGVPLGANSGIWGTAAFTRLGANDTFAGWPRRDWLQMYEVSLEIGAGPQLGFIFQARYESPLFNKEYLTFNYTTTAPQDRLEEQVASGWNALVDWRGSESIGVRWRWGQGSQVNFLFVEDWGIGTQDQASDGLYINNAPDFEFMTQWHFVF